MVGMGNIAQVAMLPAFAHAQENSELVALISGTDEKREALSRKYPHIQGIGTYDDLESLIEELDIEAVYISVPNSRHREMTERAAKKGVHVLCEKPMAITVEDCQAMIEVCDQNDVKLMIAYRLHFEEANLRTIELLRSGKIGDPRIFSSVFSHQVRPGDIRTQGELGGGALDDLGIYCVNAARYLFADEPTEVFARSVSAGDPRAEDVDQTTTVVLRFPQDRMAQFTVSQGAISVSSYRVTGTEGSLRLEPAYEYSSGLKQILSVGEEETEHSWPKRDQFAPELLYFSRCILGDEEPEPSGQEGLADIRILEAATESAKSGEVVQLEPFDRDRRPGIDQLIKRPGIEPPSTVEAPSPSFE